MEEKMNTLTVESQIKEKNPKENAKDKQRGRECLPQI
jgi:hypothetical protein